MDFALTPFQQQLQQRCRDLAADFATRSATHDREASHPSENYQRLREEGFLSLTIAKEHGGAGAGLLDHTVAYEALGAGCPSTALAFNMHASVVMPILESPEVAAEIKTRLTRLVVDERKMFASMIEAADLVMVGASIEHCNPLAGIVFLLPRDAAGRRVEANWDVLGM